MKRNSLIFWGILLVSPLTAYYKNNHKNSYLKTPQSMAEAAPTFAGVWLELGGGFVSDKLIFKEEELNFKDHCRVENGLLVGRALFANVTDNNIYNALVLGVLIIPDIADGKLEISKWQEKYASQVGLEFGLPFKQAMIFSNVLVTNFKKSLAGSYGIGFAALFNKRFQLRFQVNLIKSHNKTVDDTTAKTNRIATMLTVAIKN